MAQNYEITISENFAKSTPGGEFLGTSTIASSQTKILPEIRVGGIFNANDNWGVSLAYMHAFGSNLSGSLNMSAANGVLTKNATGDSRNPTLDSILLGIRYSVV